MKLFQRIKNTKEPHALSGQITVVLAAVVIIAFIFVRVNRAQQKDISIKIGTVIVHAEVVKTDETRRKGLTGREHLPPDTGMLFVFNTLDRYGFWMKDMKFPIDMIWIQGNKIVDITPDAPAPREGQSLMVYYPQEPVNFVLEVNAGFAERAGIKMGDTIEFLDSW